MNIYCLSEGELYNIENGKEHLVHCERVESYRNAVRKMRPVMNGKPQVKAQSSWALSKRNTARMKPSIC